MVSLENILCILCTSKTSQFSWENLFSTVTTSTGKEAVYAGHCEIPMHRLIHLCLAHGKHLPQPEHVLFCHNWKRTVVIWCADS